LKLQRGTQGLDGNLQVARIGDPEREIWYPEIPFHELIFDIENLTTAFSAGREPGLSLRRAQFVLSLALHYFTAAPIDNKLDDVAVQIFRVATPRNVRPVTVHFSGREYLALVPHSVLDDDCDYQYYLVATKGE
jgi:hypothetical protein